MKKILPLLVLVIALFSNCSTDLNVMDDYHETMVVYGLVNQADTAQYIKINKAFLGAGNALEMAQVYDSVNYANNLSVKLERIYNGSVTSTITLSRDSSISKPSGIFSYPKQILYKTTSALFEDSQYRLTIINNNTQKTVTATTSLVKDFLITKPTTAQFIGLTSAFAPFKVQWTSAVNGKAYALTIRFHYVEVDKVVTTDTTKKYIDWVFSTRKTLSTQGGESMEESFLGSEFFQYLKNTVPVSSTHKRHAGKLDFIITVAGEDLTTYVEVSQPSIGIIQEKPQYSNLTNAYGIFSSRYTKSVKDRPLSTQSLDSLYGGQYTKTLFCDPNPLSTNFCN